MALRKFIIHGFCCCCCCYNNGRRLVGIQRRNLLAVILIFTIAMGAPHADLGNPASANYLTPTSSLGYFATRNNTKVTAQRGGTALLPCTVLTQSSALVSWVRRRDFQLLTVGLSTYSSDERFLVEHIRHMGHWALRIKAVREEDRGLYECQLSVHPVQSVFVELKVVEAVAEIVGAPDLHIDEGSTLRLECKLKRATEYPAYVFWYHEQNMVNFDQQNGFSVTPFQPTTGPSSSSTAAAPFSGTGSHGLGTAMANDQQHHAPFHEMNSQQNPLAAHPHPHHHHHHLQHLHHHLQYLHRQHNFPHQHHHHHHHHSRGSSPGGGIDDDDATFGLNALDVLAARPDAALWDDPSSSFPGSDSSSWGTDDPSLSSPSTEEGAGGFTGELSALDRLHYLAHLNHSGLLRLLYSHILPSATSVLTIKGVHLKHAGNYTCAPSNTQPASITVHVLQGEKPAAMQHANRSQLDQQQQQSDGSGKTSSKGASSSSSSSSISISSWFHAYRTSQVALGSNSFRQLILQQILSLWPILLTLALLSAPTTTTITLALTSTTVSPVAGKKSTLKAAETERNRNRNQNQIR
ncbi:uncharacterized protein LOC129744755 [Uranotaenia lowii]|uniref:uncharacterized protein LOC129744755 n=1 Tax=Uranotaenia lowii TaxID=190385 RepID=UPI002479B0AF|nr:uncharacterized protein LOC129744755 [Uranotaenia lowii]XP_055593426.1 uncharacterized protein LOC129744755 [Uranotaenia lowii]